MYLLYNSFGFTGIYILVIIVSVLISIMLFNNLIKEKNNIFLSLIIALLSIYWSKFAFVARNQIFSFLIFELEIYCLIGLLEYGKKRYFYFLIILAFLLVLFHDTLYFLFFVMMLPYLADVLVSKIFDLKNSYRFKNSNLKNVKYLIILFIILIPIGFCTPILGSSYTNMINCMNGISTEFINELKTVEIIDNIPLATITFLTIGLLGFTKAKFKLKDILFTFGLIIFAMMARRNLFFLYLIGTIFLSNIITECINTYIGKEKVCYWCEKIVNSKYIITVIFCFISIISIYNFSYEFPKKYVSDYIYPRDATKWLLNNVDCENMKLWNDFSWGGYLEFNGIKVFVDSRTGMYTEQENKDCTVLKDWYNVNDQKVDYNSILKKYSITHIMIPSYNELNDSLEKDDNYNLIYHDSVAVIYETNFGKNPE